MNRSLESFFRDVEGATAIEYGAIALLVSIMIVAGATTVGNKLVAIFDAVASGF